MNPSSDKSQSYSIARLASFVVLLIILAVISVLFYRVMKSFILPVFLAALTVVIFKPFHVWVLSRCGKRRRLAAFLTTSLVAMLIIGPMSMFGFFAIDEGRQLVKGNWQIQKQLTELRKKIGLEIPAKDQLDDVRNRYDALLETFDDGTEVLNLSDDEVSSLTAGLEELQEQLEARSAEFLDGIPRDSLDSVRSQLTDNEFENAERIWHERNSDEPRTSETTPEQAVSKQAVRLLQSRSYLDASIQRIAQFAALDDDGEIPSSRQDELKTAVDGSRDSYESMRVHLLGGVPWSIVKELTHPNEQQFADWKAKAGSYLTKLTLYVSGRTPALLARSLLVISIMLLAIYYFLLDGPEMIKTMMRLSPLDDDYEAELLVEFDRVSRAVVLATLLSALAQGLLAGVGYFLFGVPSVFLLTLLTAVLAMVPFVGAAAVWVPAAIYLAFFIDPSRSGAAIGLAIYGFFVVSMADNIIKPYVLHGQSNLHPLLALLGVLGGVQSLGAVGILVGPMVVAFLQALLNILRKEMMSHEDSVA